MQRLAKMVLVALGAAACSTPPVNYAGKSCDNGACPSGYRCETSTNQCVEAANCQNDQQCLAGQECQNGSCVPLPLCRNGAKDGEETDVDCGGTCTTQCADGKACKVAADCASGLCKELVCRPCGADADCPKADVCQQGQCKPAENPECSADAECTTPGKCQSSQGAWCEGGRCHYQASLCQQGQPTNPCRKSQGTCDVNKANCEGLGCCVFDPTWPSGSADPQPACPHHGQDDGNGVLDSGENWTGKCDHNGACDECQSNGDCLASSSCYQASCVDGICREVLAIQIGQKCLNPAAPNGGVCTQVGEKVDCLLDTGTACGTAGDCATGYCVDGFCCDRACGGNCARCNLPGAEGTCSKDQALCTGDCDVCNLSNNQFMCEPQQSLCQGSCSTCTGSGNAFSCTADAAKCTGDCASCSQEGTAFNCKADEAKCTGNCDTCSGSGTTFACAAVDSACTGDCATCAPLTGAAGFSCAATQSACAGDCAVCDGADTSFSCKGDESKCPGNCRTCVAGGGGFSCQSELDGFTCGTQSCSAYTTYRATQASVDGDDQCITRSYADCDLTCSSGVCASSCQCTNYSDNVTATCGSCSYANATGSGCSCAPYPTTQTCTWNGRSAPNYRCNGSGACGCLSSAGTATPDGVDNDCDGQVDESDFSGFSNTWATNGANRTCASACARLGAYCASVVAGWYGLNTVATWSSATGCTSRAGDCNTQMQAIPGYPTNYCSAIGWGPYEDTLCNCYYYQ